MNRGERMQKREKEAGSLKRGGNKQGEMINITNHTSRHSFGLQEILLIGQLASGLHLVNLQR